MDVIYDSVVHALKPFDITHKYQMKYNTVRSIINGFKSKSRVNIKKKVSGYTYKIRATTGGAR